MYVVDTSQCIAVWVRLTLYVWLKVGTNAQKVAECMHEYHGVWESLGQTAWGTLTENRMQCETCGIESLREWHSLCIFVCKGVLCDFATWSRLFVPWHYRALSWRICRLTCFPSAGKKLIRTSKKVFSFSTRPFKIRKLTIETCRHFLLDHFGPLKTTKPQATANPRWWPHRYGRCGTILKCFLVIAHNSWWHVLLYLNHMYIYICIKNTDILL